MRGINACGFVCAASFLLLAGESIVAGVAWGGPAPQPSSAASAAELSRPGEAVPDLGNEHISTLDTPHPPYNSNPPTSGWHIPFIATWGVHQKPIPRELQVHNLEDGGVLIQYACPVACPGLVAKLERLAKRVLARPEPRYHHLIVAPHPDAEPGRPPEPPGRQSAPVLALTAWTRIDRLTAFDDARITRFIEAYIGVDHHKGRE